MTERSIYGGLGPLPTAPVITLASRHSAGAAVRFSGAGGAASGANPFAANEMLAFPFTLTAPTLMNKVFWVNGSSVANNCSVGLYNADFELLAETASTGLSGASVPQVVTLTRRLSPGLYYLALAHNSATTNRLFRWSFATLGDEMWRILGCWRQASITLGALPATATPVACNNVGFPLFGLITRTVFDV